MKIKQVDPFILHIPVTGSSISDSTHTITHWGVVGARVETQDGLKGWGFTGTHAYLPGDQLIAMCIKECYAPLLVGESALETEKLWKKMAFFPAMQWIGRAGITELAIGAIETALWDLKAKKHEKPLWKLLEGSSTKELPAYNTDIGWLSIPLDKLVDGAKRVIEVEGFKGVKIKIGTSEPGNDLKRLEAVRKAIGNDKMMAIDANGRWDLQTCIQFCKEAESLNIYWFEEPLWYDDIIAHVELSQQTQIPIALGEQLYSVDAFNTFIDAEAVHYVQPDITRLPGIKAFLEVADTAYKRHLPVAPHVGDMGQVHVHLAFSHPGCSILEYIPWIKEAFEEPIRIVDGYYQRPELPGAGTTPTKQALNQYSRPLI